MQPHVPPLVMGIVNVTPDSFSDGGRFLAREAALAHARRLIADGADILDIGGESTRPGSEPVAEAEELARVVPVIEALAAETDRPISVDTAKPTVARAAVAAGARIWNDVTALTGAPDSLETAAGLGCEIVLMHMKGEPRTMQESPVYGDVAREVRLFLVERAAAAQAGGVKEVWVDPGIGFGKTLAHNLEVLGRLGELVAEGFPVVVGTSRKSFIGHLTGGAPPDDRLEGSVATAVWAMTRGAAMVRAHDIPATVEAARLVAGAAA